MNKAEFKTVCKLSTEEIIENYLRPRRRIDNSSNLSFNEKRELLSVIFMDRDEGSAIDDGKLHDILWSLLPTAPHGNEELINRQFNIADDFVLESDEVVGFWGNFSDERLVNELAIHLNTSIPVAKDYAREIYSELWYRDKHRLVSEDVMYVFIRRMIPSTKEPNFRLVAETTIDTIIITS